MNATTMVLREERAADRDAVHALHRAAFAGNAEADLVDALRAEDAIVLSLLALEGDEVIGYVLYSRLTIETQGMQARALALAPLAVEPATQARGIGSRLVKEAHRRLTANGETLIFVLGEPSYYQRFGFSAAAARNFRTPYDGPYMMALALNPSAVKDGVVHYPATFTQLG